MLTVPGLHTMLKTQSCAQSILQPKDTAWGCVGCPFLYVQGEGFSSCESGGSSKVAERIGGRASNAEISETMFSDNLGVKKVAAIYDDGVAKRLVEPWQVQRTELLPVGEDDQRIGIVGSCI